MGTTALVAIYFTWANPEGVRDAHHFRFLMMNYRLMLNDEDPVSDEFLEITWGEIVGARMSW